jgi:hypothetical protein
MLPTGWLMMMLPEGERGCQDTWRTQRRTRDVVLRSRFPPLTPSIITRCIRLDVYSAFYRNKDSATILARMHM